MGTHLQPRHPACRSRRTRSLDKPPVRAGQSLTEFALIAPLLVLLVFGIVELGLLFHVYISLTNSAREAARSGAVYQYTGTPFLSTDSTATTTIDAERQQSITSAINATLSPLLTPADVTATISYTPTASLATNPYRAGNTLAVQLLNTHVPFFGMLGIQPITIRAQSSMRIEPGGEK